MRDPSLAPSLFDRDRVLSRETLLEAHDFAALQGAQPRGETALFSASCRLIVTIPAPAFDLSRFNRFSLVAKNCTQGTLLVGMRLLRRSYPGSCGEDLSFTGGREQLLPGQWKTLRFPRESFGTYGASTDWKHLRTLELFFGFDRTHEGPADIEVVIKLLVAECRDIPSGPRLTRNGLYEELKPNTSFEDILDPVAAPDRKPGSSQESGQMRMSPDLGLWAPPPHPYPRETADEILSGRIMGQELGEPIHWGTNPLGIQEWTHFLNRHHFMRTLVIELVETRDQRYAAALNRHIASWIAENPVPVDSDGGAGPTWETLSAAWRLREWAWVRRCAWPSAVLSNHTRELMLRSVWEHARHLMDHRGHPNNWIMVESCALALAGMWFPEFRDADLWVRTGVERLSTEFRRQFFADGTHFEISPLYHAICAHAMLEVRQSARTCDLALPEEFDRPLERCFTYLAALCRPDFTWPSLNDAGSADSDYTALMRMAGEAFDRPDLLWLGTRGSRGAAPERLFHVFPDAGIAAMRSGYTTDANFLIFRAGPPGAAHVHDDVLGVDVTALGVPRLVDPGITTYAPNVLSDYYRSAMAHSTVLVDDVAPTRGTMPFHQRIEPAGDRFSWRSGEGFHAAFAMYRGDSAETLEDVIVHRAVIFVGCEYWIVRDAVLAEREHQIVTCWQFFPARVQTDPDTSGTRVVDAKGPQFEVIPVPGFNEWDIDLRVGSSSPVAGWTSVGGQDQPSFSVRYRTLGRLPFVQEWILLPFRGRPYAGIEVMRSGGPGESTDLRISFPDGRTDLVTVGPFVRALPLKNPSVAIQVTRKCSCG